MKKILFVTAVPETASAFLSGYLNTLADEYDVHFATSLSGHTSVDKVSTKVTLHDIEIARKPSIAKDILSLFHLWKLIRKEQFDVVHSVTPKAGLVTQLAAFLARIPNRFHTFTGQVWATKTGIKRTLLKWLDKLSASLTTACLADSPSQRQFILENGITTDSKCTVLAKGSISGVNLEKFQHNQNARHQLRDNLGINKNTFVFLFVGRLNREKGIPELLTAFRRLTAKRPIKLLFIGADEEGFSEEINQQSGMEFLGFQRNINDFYSMADCLVLPSHREGFGNVIIEAAACKLPAIASNIYGLSDAIEDNYSGLLHPVKNVEALAQLMQRLIDSPTLANTLSEQAYQRVVTDFDEKHLINAFIAYYQAQLGLTSSISHNGNPNDKDNGLTPNSPTTEENESRDTNEKIV